MAKHKIKMDVVQQQVVEAFVPKVIRNTCVICSYIRLDMGRDAVIGTQLKAVHLYPCRRYPAAVMVEKSEFCGEFKAKEV
jgi:hypothetical protein